MFLKVIFDSISVYTRCFLCKYSHLTANNNMRTSFVNKFLDKHFGGLYDFNSASSILQRRTKTLLFRGRIYGAYSSLSMYTVCTVWTPKPY